MSRLIADVIVIGGGIIGCSAAFHLARRKGTRVLVVEKGPLASGMTKRSGGFVRAALATPTETALALASAKYFRAWKDSVGGNCGFTPVGLIIVAPEEHAARLRDSLTQWNALGASIQTLARGDVRDLQPKAHVDDIALAAHDPQAGYVDAGLATHAFAARAKELGAVFKTGTMVKRIRLEYGRVVGVETNIGLVESLNVVVCAGAWSDRLLAPLHAEIGLRARRVSLAFFERPAELRVGHLAFEDWVTGAHFRPHTFGLTTGGLVAPAEETSPDSFDESISSTFIARMQEKMAARLPALAQARYLRGHAGVYEARADGRAMLGRVPGIAGLCVAAGFGASGLTMAPAIGACVEELVLDGEARTVDVRAWGAERET